MPVWFLLAFVPPFLFMCTNIIDVVLVRRVVQAVQLGPLLFFTFLSNAAMMLVSFSFLRFALPPMSPHALYPLVGGFFYIIYLVPYYHAVSRYDPDAVVPFFTFIPAFVAILSVFFLHETISPLGLVGILLICVGVMGSSMRSWKEFFKAPRELWLWMLLAPLSISIGVILFKFSSKTFSFWQNSFLTALGAALTISGLFLVRPSAFRQVREVFLRSPISYIGLNIFNEFFDQSAGATLRYVLTIGPTAYVQAISTAVQPIYMAIGWRVLGHFMPSDEEASTVSTFSRRLVHIAIAGAGVLLLYVFSNVSNYAR